MTTEATPLLIVGGTGRIGRALRRQDAAFEAAHLRPIWQSRAQTPGFMAWDILAEQCPAGAARGVVLCLAGVIRGGPTELARNEALALAACSAAAEQGARHVFLASSAAIYGPSDSALSEQARPAPPGPYGAAKLMMERAAARVARDWHRADGPGLTILRIGNIAGFDALLGGMIPGTSVWLDPVEGQRGGPVRSYIGPLTLGAVLAQLMGLAATGKRLPRVLNIAAAPAVSMADLLVAAGADWGYGQPDPAVVPRVELDTGLLRRLVDMPAQAGQAAALVAEWRSMAE